MPATGDATLKQEEGSAVIEMIFCMVFVFLLIAFVVQQVSFALDYAKAGDMLYYDLLIEARQNEVNADPHPVPVKSQSVSLREVPLLRSMLDLDTSSLPPKVLKMTAAGGTHGEGSGFFYDLADNPALPNWWQPLLAGAEAPAKTIAMVVAANIGYNNATN
jgi:hypothetical protein